MKIEFDNFERFGSEITEGVFLTSLKANLLDVFDFSILGAVPPPDTSDTDESHCRLPQYRISLMWMFEKTLMNKLREVLAQSCAFPTFGYASRPTFTIKVTEPFDPEVVMKHCIIEKLRVERRSFASVNSYVILADIIS